jgi:hypothetical protein
MSLNLPAGMQINAPIKPGYESILTPKRSNWSPSCTAPSKPAARNC